MTDRPEPLPHWWDQCRKESFAEHVAECTTPIMAGRPAMPTPVSDALAEEADVDELLCPLCEQPISDGDRRVSWFAKAGGEVTERGATHLTCPAKDWDRVHNRPADIYTPPEDRVARPSAHLESKSTT